MSSIFIFRSCTFIRCLPPLIRSLLWTRLWLCSVPNIWPVVCRLPSLVWNTFWIKIVFLIIDDGVARCRMFSTIAPSFISVRISIYSHRLMNNFFIKVKSSTFYKHLQHVKWKYYLVLALKRQMYVRRSKINICYCFHRYFDWWNILKILLGNILWWIKVYWCIAFLQQNFTRRMFCIFGRAANIHLLLVMFWWMSYEEAGPDRATSAQCILHFFITLSIWHFLSAAPRQWQLVIVILQLGFHLSPGYPRGHFLFMPSNATNIS